MLSFINHLSGCLLQKMLPNRLSLGYMNPTSIGMTTVFKERDQAGAPNRRSGFPSLGAPGKAWILCERSGRCAALACNRWTQLWHVLRGGGSAPSRRTRAAGTRTDVAGLPPCLGSRSRWNDWQDEIRPANGRGGRRQISIKQPAAFGFSCVLLQTASRAETAVGRLGCAGPNDWS